MKICVRTRARYTISPQILLQKSMSEIESKRCSSHSLHIKSIVFKHLLKVYQTLYWCIENPVSFIFHLGSMCSFQFISCNHSMFLDFTIVFRRRYSPRLLCSLYAKLIHIDCNLLDDLNKSTNFLLLFLPPS